MPNMPHLPRRPGEPPAAFMEFGAGIPRRDSASSGKFGHRSYGYIAARLRRALEPRDGAGLDALRVLVHFRELIEIEDAAGTLTRDRLPLLRLFTHWMVHADVTENPGARRLLERLYGRVEARMLISVARGYEALVLYFADAILDVLSLPQLRRECRELCDRHELPTGWCDSCSRWRGFGGSMVTELEGKPLGFPSVTRTMPTPDATEDRPIRRAREQRGRLGERRVHPTFKPAALDLSVRRRDSPRSDLLWALRFTFNEAGELGEYVVVIGWGEDESAFTAP